MARYYDPSQGDPMSPPPSGVRVMAQGGEMWLSALCGKAEPMDGVLRIISSDVELQSSTSLGRPARTSRGRALMMMSVEVRGSVTLSDHRSRALTISG